MRYREMVKEMAHDLQSVESEKDEVETEELDLERDSKDVDKAKAIESKKFIKNDRRAKSAV